jgi:hypothetical protein
MLSGLAFGAAVITKENAIFFAPVLGYLLITRGDVKLEIDRVVK